MKHKLDLVRGWLLKGDSDLLNAKRTVNSEGPYDTACFHAQQAVEKYLKAVLIYDDQLVPKTHDLEELQLLCESLVNNREFSDLELVELSDYAVSVRYDFEFWPDIEIVKEAVQVRVLVCSSLEIDMPFAGDML
ncbi:MAG: HEPN domain-containing protein [Mariprofundaceae bacterium]|nr:HEPN domain-containing protein [Mariprofundaceae bacterium]